MFVYLHLYGHIGWSHGQSNFSTSTVKSAYLSLYGLAEGVSDIYTAAKMKHSHDIRSVDEYREFDVINYKTETIKILSIWSTCTGSTRGKSSLLLRLAFFSTCQFFSV